MSGGTFHGNVGSNSAFHGGSFSATRAAIAPQVGSAATGHPAGGSFLGNHAAVAHNFGGSSFGAGSSFSGRHPDGFGATGSGGRTAIAGSPGIGSGTFAARHTQSFSGTRVNNFNTVNNFSGHGGWGGGRGGWGWRRGGGYPYFGYGLYGFPLLSFGLGGYGGYGYGGYGGYGYGGYGGYGGGYGNWGYGYPAYGDGYASYGYDPYAAGYGQYAAVDPGYVDPNAYGAAVYPPATAALPPDAVATTAAPVVDGTANLGWTDKGEAAFKAGDYNAAVYNLRHALVDDPENPVVVMMLGQALFATGKVEEAAGATQAAMHVLPKEQWGVVVSNYKELYGNPQDYTTQLRTLEQAVRDKPDSPALRFLAGFHYAYLGFPQQAIDQLERVLKLAPQDEAAKLLRDEMRSKLSQPAGAPGNGPTI